MKRVTVELDDETASRLDAVAPEGPRRSAFILRAIRQALWAIDEGATEAGYRAHPDDESAYFEPRPWEPGTAAPPPPRRKGHQT